MREKRGEKRENGLGPRSDLQTRVYHRRRIYFGGCNHLSLRRCRSSLITSYSPSAVGARPTGWRQRGGERGRLDLSPGGGSNCQRNHTRCTNRPPSLLPSSASARSLVRVTPSHKTDPRGARTRIPMAKIRFWDQIDDLRKMSRGY